VPDTKVMKSLAVYILAGLCEIGAALRSGAGSARASTFGGSGRGVIALIFFAALLTFVDSAVARRVYGAIYTVW
jgi:drug/metabolite transporter superfamily protein YnfA